MVDNRLSSPEIITSINCPIEPAGQWTSVLLKCTPFHVMLILQQLLMDVEADSYANGTILCYFQVLVHTLAWEKSGFSFYLAEEHLLFGDIYVVIIRSLNIGS